MIQCSLLGNDVERFSLIMFSRKSSFIHQIFLNRNESVLKFIFSSVSRLNLKHIKTGKKPNIIVQQSYHFSIQYLYLNFWNRQESTNQPTIRWFFKHITTIYRTQFTYHLHSMCVSSSCIQNQILNVNVANIYVII